MHTHTGHITYTHTHIQAHNHINIHRHMYGVIVLFLVTNQIMINMIRKETI